MQVSGYIRCKVMIISKTAYWGGSDRYSFGWRCLFIWWVSKGRFIQTTDDTYIGGNITTVASKVSGYISAIEVRDNQSVKKGDIILRLDDRDYRANVARLEGFRSSLRWPHRNINAGEFQKNG